MIEYPKIQTLFFRDPETKHKTLLEGQWSLPVFEYLQNNQWDFTEKVDGTNIRVNVHASGGVGFSGRTDNAQIPATLITALQRSFPEGEVQERLAAGGNSAEVITLYGEGYGARIQKGGGNYRKDQGFVLFDVRVGPWWLERESVVEVARTLGIEVVPLIGTGTLHDMVNICKAGLTSEWGNFHAEGIVARPSVSVLCRNGNRVIAKLKLKDFPR